MILFLEQKKLHRTGYLPIFLAGGILAAIVPLVNMAVRPDSFTGLSGRAFPILMDANWGMMAQLTILLAVCGCCLIYHTEYADKGDLKMNTLPIRQFSLFFGKFGISLLSVTLALLIQGAALALACFHWFPDRCVSLKELIQGMGFELILLLPTLTLMLFAASLCQNMWISLGIGVILTFAGSMIHDEQLLLSLLPFAAPYRMLHAIPPEKANLCLTFCAAQAFLFGAMELIYLRIRRNFV
jgi:hypothetical protein